MFQLQPAIIKPTTERRPGTINDCAQSKNVPGLRSVFDLKMAGCSCNMLQSLYARINPSNAELNPICHFLALLGAHHILHISRIRVNYQLDTLIIIYS